MAYSLFMKPFLSESCGRTDRVAGEGREKAGERKAERKGGETEKRVEWRRKGREREGE